MIHYFDPAAGVIRDGVRLLGPAGDYRAHFAVDTGATRTCVRVETLLHLGYPLANGTTKTRLATPTRVEDVYQLRVLSLEALGIRRDGLHVYAVDLPLAAELDGLLGLDFFRNTRLVLDFKKGRLRLT